MTTMTMGTNRENMETITMGMRAKVVGGTPNNLTVQFEDGTLRTGITSNQFKRGNISGRRGLERRAGAERKVGTERRAGARRRPESCETIEKRDTANRHWRELDRHGEAMVIGETPSKLTLMFEDGTIRAGVNINKHRRHQEFAH